MHGTNEKYVQRLVAKLEGKRVLEEQDVDGSIH
jgi:hypothetical protein